MAETEEIQTEEIQTEEIQTEEIQTEETQCEETQCEEIAPDEPESEQCQEKYPDRPSNNPSVLRCIRAWNRAFNKKLEELEEDESDFEAREAGKNFYLRAIPPLAGLNNIRDFIACVTYAQLVDVLRPNEAESLFAAVKIALSALRRET